ncbi:glycosyltransferase family 2 protein [Candidatus Uhrbacteria bacterium]|nr:glycosyltransferase family 2 protein [Candidatus Uhrbacteria bacterium]
MTSLFLVLPTHNEARVLEKNLRAVHAFCLAHLTAYAWEICIADNGSRDETPHIAERLSSELPHVEWSAMQEAGRGGALRRAWGNASADILAYMDADLATDLSALPLLLRALDHGADIAVGSRFVDGASVFRSLHREIFSRGYNLLVRMLLGLRVRDAQCGFKAFTKKAALELLPLTHNTQWFFDTELLYCAQNRGMRITEVPVAWVESRDKGRKSTVRILQTMIAYIIAIVQLRLRKENVRS